MALKARLRNKRSKRFGNVADFHSSDSETGEALKQYKVREGFSISRLNKNSENYKIVGDHMYTAKRRKISEDSDEKPGRQRCFSKNAIMARLNRERKKLYITTLETENEKLRKEKDEINKKIQTQNETISEMKHEILYLKGLLANSKDIGQILQTLKATGLTVTSTVMSTTEDCVTDQNATVEELDHPRVRSVDSSFLLINDINLGTCSDYGVAPSQSPLFDFESDYFDDFQPYLTSDVPNNSLNLNLDKNEDSSKLDDFSSSPGICLHVNKKRISVEFCSICNSKANSSVLQTGKHL